jgi:hypothetical protein
LFYAFHSGQNKTICHATYFLKNQNQYINLQPAINQILPFRKCPRHTAERLCSREGFLRNLLMVTAAYFQPEHYFIPDEKPTNKQQIPHKTTREMAYKKTIAPATMAERGDTFFKPGHYRKFRLHSVSLKCLPLVTFAATIVCL